MTEKYWLVLVKCDSAPPHRDITYLKKPESEEPVEGERIYGRWCNNCGGVLTIYAYLEQQPEQIPPQFLREIEASTLWSTLVKSKMSTIRAIDRTIAEFQVLQEKIQSGRDPHGGFGMDAPSEFWTKEDEQERGVRRERFAREEIERICEELRSAML